jgi:tellurite resistance protein TerC
MEAGTVMGWWWLVFGVVVVGLLALDLLVFHRHARTERFREAVLWSVFWVAIGLGFAGFVAYARGSDAAFAYLTAFLIEKSLSVENLFVFLALFTYFAVAPENHHRVLFWGIIGAILTRGVFIFAGIELVRAFHPMIYVLGVVLVATGAKLFLSEEEEMHPERNPVVRFASRVLPIERSYSGERFTVRTTRGWRFTPLFLVLVAIETMDVLFAVDSVPAVIAVSQDTFVVYSSNIFAILGLRALYFVLARALSTLALLRPALAVILALVGTKMLLSDVVEVPTAVSLLVVAVILTGATVLSVVMARRQRAMVPPEEEPLPLDDVTVRISVPRELRSPDRGSPPTSSSPRDGSPDE